MGSLGFWPCIAWSRHAIRMFRVRNLGLISVMRNQIGSYNELNCWVAPSPIYLSRVVLDLTEGDIMLLCSRPCSFAYQIGKALMVWVTLNDPLFKQSLHPSMHTSGCHTTLISALEPYFLQCIFGEKNGSKVELGALRGFVPPTHFQKQVGRGNWLGLNRVPLSSATSQLMSF